MYASTQTLQSLAILILSSVSRIFTDAVSTIPKMTFRFLSTYLTDYVHLYVLKDKNYDIHKK